MTQVLINKLKCLCVPETNEYRGWVSVLIKLMNTEDVCPCLLIRSFRGRAPDRAQQSLWPISQKRDVTNCRIISSSVCLQVCVCDRDRRQMRQKFKMRKIINLICASVRVCVCVCFQLSQWQWVSTRSHSSAAHIDTETPTSPEHGYV